MAARIGTRIGPYDIQASLGAGGMGEVYRARDTRLDRDVAIKVLPDLFASDPERLARFEREAKTLASLNHPHIAQIYGVEDAGPMRALVMELVDGEDLATRLQGGAIPQADALPIARQIAEALEAAHERGIIHRDLKPANVKLAPDGTVKVLDFGLAKAMGTAAPAGQAAIDAPTFTSPARVTQAGVILGTAAYMAPEQAKGKLVDRRADMWALGVVLYEMLTGRTAFDGETVTDVLAAIVTRDPDWSALPPDTPPSVRRLLGRCLERDPRRRLADAGEAAFQLGEAIAGPSTPPAAPAGRRSRPRLAWVPWTIALLAVVVAAVTAWRGRGTAPTTSSAVRYVVDMPQRVAVSTVLRPALAISPDGSTLVFAATAGGIPRLMMRRRNEFETRPLPGTEGASNPVFSPDGRWVAFFADNYLNKVPIQGGPVVRLTSVNDPRGLSWDNDDTITYTPEAVKGVFQIAAAGGAPKEITRPGNKAERTHRWPQALPGNKAVLFTVGTFGSPDNYDTSNLEAEVLATGERRVVLSGASMARYVPTGHIVFARAATLYAVPFDVDRVQVTGTPEAVLQGVAGDSTTGAAHFSCSRSGTLAYVAGSAEGLQHRLIWTDRTGKIEPVPTPVGIYFDPVFSPDGRRLAVTVLRGGSTDVWVYDFARNTFTRLTFGGSNLTPAWSRDGSAVYFVTVGDGAEAPNTIWRKPADGSREAEALVTLPYRVYLKRISDDGRSALIEHQTLTANTNIERVALEKNAAPSDLVASKFDDFSSSLSPNGRFLAYQSDETARYEVYVRDLSSGGRWQVSSAGGEEPRWSPDGKLLYYRSDTTMMGVAVETTAAFDAAPPVPLFEGIYNLRSDSNASYDVHPKSGRLLMIRPAEDNSPAGVRVVLDWFAELRRVGRPPPQ